MPISSLCINYETTKLQYPIVIKVFEFEKENNHKIIYVITLFDFYTRSKPHMCNMCNNNLSYQLGFSSCDFKNFPFSSIHKHFSSFACKLTSNK
jgi:hypothetical protein